MCTQLRLHVAILLTGLLSAACSPLERDFFLGPANDCFEARELTANVQNLAFTFDSQGVGYFAVNKGAQVLLGSSRPGDGLAVATGLEGGVMELAVDAEGQRHLSLTSGSTTIYARESHGSWSQIELALDSYPLALRLDPKGAAHMLLKLKLGTGFRINYATNSSGVWKFQELPPIPDNQGVDMEIDARGHVHLVYFNSRPTAQYNRGIYYATNAPGDWRFEQVNDLESNRPILALDSDGHPHLLYSTFGVGSIYHAKKQQGQWLNIYLEPPAFAEFDGVYDLKVDATGALHTVLFQLNETSLVYANVPSEGRVLSLTPLLRWTLVPPPYFLGLNVAGSARIGYLNITLDSNGSMIRNSVTLAEPCH